MLKRDYTPMKAFETVKIKKIEQNFVIGTPVIPHNLLPFTTYACYLRYVDHCANDK
jgi:hypothetical protein